MLSAERVITLVATSWLVLMQKIVELLSEVGLNQT